MNNSFMPLVVFRVDCSAAIGMGHIMRCLGLAQALREKGIRVLFALSESSPAIERRLLENQINSETLNLEAGTDEDLQAIRKLCMRLNAKMLIVDGYCFAADWLERVHDNRWSLMLWCDYVISDQLNVDVLLNQNPHAVSLGYGRVAPNAELLLGLEYAVLRSEFFQAKGLRRERQQLKELLLTFGGSDPNNTTLKVLESLEGAGFSGCVHIVIGPLNRFLDTIQPALNRNPNWRVYKDVKDMAPLISRSDLAISAAGTTLWEFAYSGLPTIAIALAENQRPLGQALAEARAGIYMGIAESYSGDRLVREFFKLRQQPASLRSYSQNMSALVDGLGRNRVVDVILTQIQKKAACD